MTTSIIIVTTIILTIKSMKQTHTMYSLGVLHRTGEVRESSLVS